MTTTYSIEPTGYQVFDSGLTLQWGMETQVENGEFTVSFPIAFDKACFYFNFIADAEAQQPNWNNIVTDLSNSCAKAFLANGANKANVYWFAIGT